MKKLLLLLTAIVTLALSGYAQDRTVSGTVVDENNGDALVGATVMPLGGGQGTATDIDGNFTLTVPPRVKEIKVTYVGYKSATVALTPGVVVKLASDNMLDEVIVTGYGSGKKLGSVVGAVSVVGSENFENVPTATFMDALQGQVSGLSIYSASGDPSSVDNSIRLRGVNSLMASNDPLFVLDGAPITQTVFTTLNPNDIENITVLKDAASVAIYGSRAANGVIVITSKKGKFNENARVNIRASMGWSQIAGDKIDMMNSEQYIAYRDAMGEPVSQEMRDAWELYGISTDWMKETFDSHAPTYNLDAAISGGSETLSYYVSLNHYAAEGIIAQSSMRRDALRFNLNARVNNWLRIGLQSNLGYTKYETNNESNAVYSGSGIYTTNPMVFARKAFPMDSPYYWTVNENGQAVFGERAMYLHFTGMPTPELNQEGRQVWRNRTTINTTLSEQINPVKGLTLRAQQNVDWYDSRLSNLGFPKTPFTTPMGDEYDFQGSVEGYNQQSFSRYYSWTYTNTAEYTYTINDVHNLTALIGEESIISKNEGFSLFADGYVDSRTMLLGSATSITPDDISQSIVNQTFNSIFANLSYDYDGKYFGEVTYRRDGSSKFAPGHRWSNFWSVGGMWNMKAEKFLSPYTWLDDLKFHVSFGTTGNSGISNFAFMGLVGPYSTPYNGGQAIGIAQAANDKLSWETVRSLDLGFNFGFMKIFTGEVDFYNKETIDMLLEIPWSFTTGFSGGVGNIGNMRNTGVDFDVTAAIIKNKDWYWGLRANFNYNHNEITKLFDGQDYLTLTNAGLQYRVGHNAGELYAVPYAGVDPRDGRQMWIDRDGNLTKTFNEERDARLLGKSMYAPWGGGFGTDLTWKGLSLKVDFNWAADKYMLNNDLWFIENSQFAKSYNQTTRMLTAWQQPGDITDVPKYGEKQQFDTRQIEDASFVRLKNLTLQYSLPQSVLNKLYLRGLSVHFTGRNLLTFTNYTGYDPEPETNVVAFFYPNTRQYEFGIEVSF